MALRNRYACLTVVSLQPIGAFLDWGEEKELFLPLREQVGEIQPGQRVVVFVTLDRSERPIASMRWQDFLQHSPQLLFEKQRVQLLIVADSPLGYTAIINHQHQGMLYRNEIFQPLAYGSQVTGFIKKIREDGKVDLTLQPQGRGANADLEQVILHRLKTEGGFLALPESAPPEAIYEQLGVSKKRYKIALGGLYKQHRIELEAEGIRLKAEGAPG